MRIILLDGENKVIGVRYGNVLGEREIFSEEGELGQIMLEDGSFIWPDPEPEEPHETIEEKLDRIERDFQETKLVQYDALATIFEEILLIQDKLNGGGTND